MVRVAAAVLVLAVTFAAGVVAGRAWDAEDPQVGVDPDGEAVDPPGGAGTPHPLGVEGAVGPWAVRVEAFQPEATDQVLAANQFNVAPPEGMTYAIVSVSIRRRAAGPGVLRGSLAPALVVPAGTAYPLGLGCGVLPAPLDPERLVGEGEDLRGQWCWPLPAAEVEKVDLRIAGTGGGEVWFELR